MRTIRESSLTIQERIDVEKDREVKMKFYGTASSNS
jgi:hypothetical protein